MGDEAAPADRAEPGGKRRVAPEFPERLPGLDEAFLRELVGKLAPGDMDEEGAQAALVILDEQPERPAVAAGRAAAQNDIGVTRRRQCPPRPSGGADSGGRAGPRRP